MNHIPARYIAESSAALDPQPTPDTQDTNELAESGARMLRTHNLRKQDADRTRDISAPFGGSFAPDSSRIADALGLAAVAWQEANMSAAAGETLLSRVIGGHLCGHQADRGPSATPALIAEVFQMRARATDLLHDVFKLVR